LVVGRSRRLLEVTGNLMLAFFLLVLLVFRGTGSAEHQRRATDDTKETHITRADLPGFLVIGIEARTTNAREATAAGIIPQQWQKFFQEGIQSKIPDKVGSNIYAVYFDYASDHNGEYTYLIGAMVKDGTAPPAGMVAKRIPAGQYAVLTTDKGPLPQVVPGTWQKIFKLEDDRNLKRAYQADFEIFDQRAQDPQNAELDIYVGVK